VIRWFWFANDLPLFPGSAVSGNILTCQGITFPFPGDIRRSRFCFPLPHLTAFIPETGFAASIRFFKEKEYVSA